MKKRTESLQIRLTDRTKRRLSTLANDKSMSMNDIVNLAIKNYLDDYDMTYTEPDMVLDRMNSVLRSQMNMVDQVRDVKDRLKTIEEYVESINERI